MKGLMMFQLEHICCFHRAFRVRFRQIVLIPVVLWVSLSAYGDNPLNDLKSRLWASQFEVIESCEGQQDEGHCWALAVLRAMRDRPVLLERLISSLTQIYTGSSEMTDLQIAFQSLHLTQPSTGVQAHILTQQLAVMLNMSIMVMEQSDQGVLIYTVTATEGEPLVDVIAAVSSIEEVSQELLLTYLFAADISLLLSSEHVQAITSTPLAQPEPSSRSIRVEHPLPASPIGYVNFVTGLAAAGVDVQLNPSFRQKYGARGKSEEDKVREALKNIGQSRHADRLAKTNTYSDSCCRLMGQLLASIPLVSALALYNGEFTAGLYQGVKERVQQTETYQVYAAETVDTIVDKAGKLVKDMKQQVDHYWPIVLEGISALHTQGKNWWDNIGQNPLAQQCDDNGRMMVYENMNMQFIVKGSVNNHILPMLVDTGANSVSMSDYVARQIGLEGYRSFGEKAICDTANKKVVCYSFEGTVTVGCFTRQSLITVRETGVADQVLLGTSFLRQVNLAFGANGALEISKEASPDNND